MREMGDDHSKGSRTGTRVGRREREKGKVIGDEVEGVSADHVGPDGLICLSFM